MKMNIQRIEKELELRGWSKYKLAQEMGIEPNTLYAVLQKGSFKTVAAIARVLKVKEMDLVE